jgi:hypothetical protein
MIILSDMYIIYLFDVNLVTVNKQFPAETELNESQISSVIVHVISFG